MTENEANEIVWEAIRQIGGTRSVYRNPRMAYSAQSRRLVEVGEHTVEVRYGEISTPAVATIQGWVFEIHDEDIELLLRPPAPRG
jgi:23S rRNA maturation-related 3'-5' exoribonuclease YhaM